MDPSHKEPQIAQRGIVHIDAMLLAVQTSDRGTIEKTIHAHRSGFMFSYTSAHYQLHVVDRLALYPLFYTISEGVPQVSQVVDDLLPFVSRRVLHPEGYYGTGGLGKGDRTPFTPFVGIMRIPPGHYLEYKDGRHELVRYWSFEDLEDRPFEGSYEDACDILGTLIKQGVDRCYQYNANLAVHLSGGLDSGSITALLGQVKSDTIHAYAHVKPDAPDDHPTCENGYLRHYVKHYPQITIHKSYQLGLQEGYSKPIHSAGNWHFVDHDSPEGRICQDLSSRQIRYILSGVGGDELASYGHGHQKSTRMIDNDAQARRFMYWQIFAKRRMRLLAKGMLGMDGPRMDSLTQTLMMARLSGKDKYYHPAFRSAVPDLRERNVISLYWFPSTYSYRLQTLQKSHFTVRSDIWNFLGRYNGIDYMFPLLDADLVEFCASIPREFFIGKEQRQMIKTGLRKYLADDLLTGGKRPGYQAPLTRVEGPSDPATLISDRLEDINKLRSTLAACVYDLDHMEHKVMQYQKRIKWMPDSSIRTRQTLMQEITQMSIYLRQAEYINQHFDDIALDNNTVSSSQ